MSPRWLAIVAVASACSPRSVADRPEGAGHLDPFVRLARLDTPSFLEIQEVRADADRLVFCTAVQGLYVVDVGGDGAMTMRHQLRSRLGHPRFPRCYHVATDGDLIYATSRGDEIQPAFAVAFDLAGGARELPALPVSGSVEGIWAGAGRVAVALHTDGVALLEQLHDRWNGSRPERHAGGLGLHSLIVVAAYIGIAITLTPFVVHSSADAVPIARGELPP